ncbi:MAG: cytochrome c [Gemmataceae bacterium]|nr:cytochrome c [Gemmataceae bacterium]
MNPIRLRRVLFLSGAAALLVVAPVVPQQPAPPRTVPGQQPAPPARTTPRLEPVAETRLLMEGLAQSNFRGLERMLTRKPEDAESWAFARGQALLLAETANLLMLRPPRNSGQDAWMDRAMDLRAAAGRLARAAADNDYERSRAGLGEVANTCNRCHQAFRVTTRIVPFQVEPPQRKAALPERLQSLDNELARH